MKSLKGDKKTKPCALMLVALLAMAGPAALAQGQGARKQAYKEGTSRQTEELAEKRDLLLVAGIQSTLDLGFKPCEPIAECVKVINGTLVTVQYADAPSKQLVFTPIKNGETTISVRDENGNMRLILRTIVSSSNLARALREIKDLLKDIEGIEFKIMGNKIIADGEVIVPTDLNRIYAVLSDGAYKDLVLNLVTVSPIGKKILAKRMQDEVNNAKVSVRVMGDSFVLEGVVDSGDEVTRVRKIVENMMPPQVEFNAPESIVFKRPKREPIINLLRIAAKKEQPAPKLVRMTVNMVELAKTYGRNFGFSWIPGISSGGSLSFGPSTTGGVTSSSSGALAGTISNLFPKLAAAQTAGYVRILHETILLTQSGIKANAKRKQKYPVVVLDKNGNQNYQAVDVGLDMNITPTVAGGDQVTLKMGFQYSSVVGRLIGNTAPVTATSNYEGNFSVKSGESAAVMNLITNDLITDFNKDGPGQVPQDPLFSLIRSKAFTKNKSQFVIFVTPQVVESAASGTDDIKKKYGIKKRN